MAIFLECSRTGSSFSEQWTILSRGFTYYVEKQVNELGNSSVF